MSGRSLVESAAARRLAELEAWTDEHDAYPYQRALGGRSGPHVELDGRRRLMLSSYDYLGLIGDERLEAAAHAALERYGTGTGGVRLLTGTNTLHRELEAALAGCKRVEDAVTFSSGYLANLAAIATLLGPEDQVLADQLVHRSIIDGCRLARARLRRFRHNDLDALEAALARPFRGRTLVIVEGVYSMDGDLAPLAEIVRLKQRYGAFLMVDEAHALGVLGARGRGADEHHGISPDGVDLWTGSLSKALASSGGFVAGRAELGKHLRHASAPFIFSAAACPAACASALAALGILADEPGRVSRLRANVAQLTGGLVRLGLFAAASHPTPILPVAMGGERRALAAARFLFDRGVVATPIIHPAVAHGQARLRLCVTAGHTAADIDAALDAFAALHRELAVNETA